MAKGGDKRRLEENSQHIQKLRILLAVANSVTAWHYVGFAFTSIAYAFCFLGIQTALAPYWDANGVLIHSGEDLKTGGVLSYYHDIIYISAFVQLLGCYTDKAWLFFLLIPAYAIYMLVIKVLIPWMDAPEPSEIPEAEGDRKRREKKERQAARAQKFARR